MFKAAIAVQLLCEQSPLLHYSRRRSHALKPPWRQVGTHLLKMAEPQDKTSSWSSMVPILAVLHDAAAASKLHAPAQPHTRLLFPTHSPITQTPVITKACQVCSVGPSTSWFLRLFQDGRGNILITLDY